MTFKHIKSNTDCFIKYVIREEQERLAEGKKKEMNLDPEYWKRKFLYPYANAGVNIGQVRPRGHGHRASTDSLPSLNDTPPP